MTDFANVPEPNEVTFAQGRLTSRTYATRSFATQFGRDQGRPSRYIYRVFDELENTDGDWDWEVQVVYTTARKQLQLHIARDAGAIRKLKIQRVPTSGDLTKLETLLELDREQATRLVEMLRAVDGIPIEGGNSVHVDDGLLRDVFADPSAIASIYSRDPSRFRELIETDAAADDVIALQRRRQVVAQIREWLDHEESFGAARTAAGGPEHAWQTLLENNPWVLGVGLGGQLLTSWEDGQLEQAVVGRSIKGTGKRVDALLKTAGIIPSLAFAEIKHHQTQLIDKEYRPGCWSPSKELAGAVVQTQQTVHLACANLQDYLQDKSPDGELLTSGTFILRPRSYVIAGTLKELCGPNGGVYRDKFRSFELFRRNLHEPEIITFDELLARAEWNIDPESRQRNPVDQH